MSVGLLTAALVAVVLMVNARRDEPGTPGPESTPEVGRHRRGVAADAEPVLSH